MKNKIIPIMCMALCLHLNTRAQRAPTSQARDDANSLIVCATEDDFNKHEVGENAISPNRHSPTVERAQSFCGNFVTNGDFETAKILPTSGRSSNIHAGGISQNYTTDELRSWESTTYATPDFFHTSAPASSNTSPSRLGVTPYNGSGFLGLITTADLDSNHSPNVDYIEYVTQTLKEPLSSSHHYWASMQVMRSINAITGPVTVSNIYATTLGMYVTTASPINYQAQLGNGSLYFLYPTIFTPSSPNTSPAGCGIQSKTTITANQWTRVSGTFQGVDNARYLNVGNFQHSVKTALYPTIPNGLYGAYSLVDDIQLYEIPEAGKDVSIVCGTNVSLGIGCDIPDATYTWTKNGAPFASVLNIKDSPTTLSTYTLTVGFPGGESFTSSATVTITASAGPDQTICLGQSATIGLGCSIPGTTYTWSAPGVTGLPTNSSTIQTNVSPTTTTTYTLTATTSNGSTSTTTTTVYVLIPAAPTDASFYTGRYDGCRRYYNVLMSAIPTATRYTAYVGVGGPTAQGSIDGIVNSSGYVDFAVDIEGAYHTVTAQITAYFGSCGTRTLTFTQMLDGPDPYCDGPGPGQSTRASTPYPNPATESVTMPEGVEDATLLDSTGKPVQKADASGKLNVSNLPDGLYNLQMLQNGKLINQHIQVKH